MIIAEGVLGVIALAVLYHAVAAAYRLVSPRYVRWRAQVRTMRERRKWTEQYLEQGERETHRQLERLEQDQIYEEERNNQAKAQRVREMHER